MTAGLIGKGGCLPLSAYLQTVEEENTMAESDELDVRAEVLTKGMQARVRTSLKKALSEQLAKEVKTLGDLRGPGGEALTIHGRTGVSNSEFDDIVTDVRR
jgi:hypothetical protein